MQLKTSVISTRPRIDIIKFFGILSRSAVLLGLCTLTAACNNSSKGGVLDPDALAARPSYTDQASRILAEHTLALLGQQDQDYRLGPEDVIDVNIFEWELSGQTKTVPVRIDQTGIISLPMVGDLQATGKTVWQLKKEIEARLQEGGYIRRPQVNIIITKFNSKKIAVVGAVQKPGVYVIERNVTTLMDVLSLSGGLSEHAGQMLYVVRRERTGGAGSPSDTDSGAVGQARPSAPGNPTTITIDLHELMDLCDLSLNIVLQSGDIVSVPEAERFFVYGYVNKPGGYNLRKPTTVLEGVALAEGVNYQLGSPEYCVLKRRAEDGRLQFIPINLDNIRKGKANNVYLQPNDTIDVRQTGLKAFGVAVEKLFTGFGFGVGYTLN